MCDGFMLVEARQYKRMRPVIKGWDARLLSRLSSPPPPPPGPRILITTCIKQFFLKINKIDNYIRFTDIGSTDLGSNDPGSNNKGHQMTYIGSNDKRSKARQRVK